MKPGDLVPWEKVKPCFETQIKALTDFLVTMVLADDFPKARYYAERVQHWEELRISVQEIYRTRQMTFSELQAIAKDLVVPPYEGPRSTAWEKLLAGVEYADGPERTRREASGKRPRRARKGHGRGQDSDD